MWNFEMEVATSAHCETKRATTQRHQEEPQSTVVASTTRLGFAAHHGRSTFGGKNCRSFQGDTHDNFRDDYQGRCCVDQWTSNFSFLPRAESIGGRPWRSWIQSWQLRWYYNEIQCAQLYPSLSWATCCIDSEFEQGRVSVKIIVDFFCVSNKNEWDNSKQVPQSTSQGLLRKEVTSEISDKYACKRTQTL